MTLLSWTHCHPLPLLSHSRYVTARCLHQLILKAKLTFVAKLVCGFMLQMLTANTAFIEWRPQVMLLLDVACAVVIYCMLLV